MNRPVRLARGDAGQVPGGAGDPSLQIFVPIGPDHWVDADGTAGTAPAADTGQIVVTVAGPATETAALISADGALARIGDLLRATAQALVLVLHNARTDDNAGSALGWSHSVWAPGWSMR